jgi:protease-4
LKKDIPVVVSFGDVAASGGYYIACGGSKIFAQDNTITGSIGVFGMMFNIKSLLNNKLGITTDAVKTSPYADFGNSTREWTETENKALQRDIDAVYTLFKKRVADARQMTAIEINEIAKGRIYTGNIAKQIGLVDELGTLKDAIDEAQKLAKLNEPTVIYYPEDKKGWDIFMNNLFGETESSKIFSLFQEEKNIYNEINRLQAYQKPQARIPFVFRIGF